MKANETNALAFMKAASQFVIPIYQRTYSWRKEECLKLWEDIIYCGTKETVKVHFLGSVVYIRKNELLNSELFVIDGQQRLTSLALLLLALEQVIDQNTIEGFSKNQIRNYYLINEYENTSKRHKFMLSKTDRETLIAIIDNTPLPKHHSVRIAQNHQLFLSWFRDSKTNIADVCKGLSKLMIVEIGLALGQDNPQLIFESLNSTGKELSQADLIRNFVLMGLEPAFQMQMYEGYWDKIEEKFGQEAYGTSFDGFMRYYLTIKTGRLIREYEVYDVYKSFYKECAQAQRDQFSKHEYTDIQLTEKLTEKLLIELYEFADIYCAIALGQEHDSDLKRAFDDIRELRADVVYPFLMEVYCDFRAQKLSKAELLHIVRLVDSYVFRRAICNVPTNSMNRTFATLAKYIEPDNYVESIEAQFVMLTSYRRFPQDDEFQREFQTRDLYKFPRRSYYLRRLENYNRDEPVSVGEYTIEHIMPQNPDLSSEWRRGLGPDWQKVQSTWLHTLGNLTLTAYNSTYSDRPFLIKRDMPSDPKKGISKSPFHLNEGIGFLDNWDESTIKDRAARLAQRGLKVWSAPIISTDTVKKYVKKTTRQEYGIDNFPSIHTGKMKSLFDAFRQAVLELDSNITEEFLKLYVAYKADTNIVDVIPLANKLKLTLNMRFINISDPHGICTDVSNVGRWGNGEVEVMLNSVDEIPYIIGLVRQSLDSQLDDEG